VPSYSLNDLAARLIASEAAAEDHRDILAMLEALAADASLPEGVCALMSDALAHWRDVSADGREQATVELQSVVVAAQNRLELRDKLALVFGEAQGSDSSAATGARRSRRKRATRPSGPARDEGAISALLPPEHDRALLGDFIAESRELLQMAEAALLDLENTPDDVEAINTVFRAFHTVKGTSAFLALDTITEFAHHAETVLSRVRDREIRCVGGYADLALRALDMLRALVDAVQDAHDSGSQVIPADYGRLLQILRDPESAGVSEAPLVSGALGASAPPHVPVATGAGAGGGLLAERGATGDAVAPSPEPAMARRGGDRAAESTVRVRTTALDRLIEMVGELVIAESMISQDPTVKRGGHHELNRKIAHADKIVRELQDLSMALRMVPLKAPFQKVARLVRDLGSRSGKRVEFVADGEDTEIDRNMVDYLADPLVHMVRNSVDHGIELPEERRAAGKPEHGTVSVSAYHASGNVVVELRDDGRGLDREKIVRKAIERGLISSGDGMADADVFDLIFAPGFSTAEQVTDVSGRGVGMDVVRRNIEALRGRVEIQSRAGQGTTFLVRLPLTLAITDGMLVRVGSERYIVPTINIHLSFRPSRAALSTVAGKGEMVMLRDDVMPLVRLHRIFGVHGAIEDPTMALLMVVGDGAQRTALLVDELLGQQQVVAKSLGNGLGRIPAISGGAILGDGRVGLILDVNELLSLARHGDVGDPHHLPARAVA